MLQRISLSAFLLVAAGTPAALAQSLADRFPGDAIVYLQADTTRFVEGTFDLDLMKLLDEPQVQEFLKPIAGQLPVSSTQGLRQMLDMVPWRQFVDGKVEVALRGVHVDLGGQGFDFSPSQPISARIVNRLVGAGSRYADSDGAPQDISIAVDFVASLDAGDGFSGMLDEHISHGQEMGFPVTRTDCEVGGHHAIKLSVPMMGGAGPAQTAYVVQDGKHFWFGGNPATLERCMKGGGQDSLAKSAAFQGFRKQTGGGDPALMLYVNVANAARIGERFVPPIMKEELDLFGVSGIESFGYSSTFVEGGVRDSVALCFNGEPTGFLSLLDCCEGGFQFLDRAPIETGFYFGARIDAGAFVDKFTRVAEELFPGSAAALEKGLSQANRMVGMDLRSQLLSAMGNEVGLYLTPPGGGSVLPEGMLMLKVGNREQFEKVLARGLSEAEQQGGLKFTEMKSLADGAKGWSLTIPDVPFQPAMAVTNDLFVVGMSAPAVKKALREMGTATTAATAKSARDSVNLQRVLKGLTGKPSDAGLSFLAFVDLGRAVQVGYQFLPMAAGEVSKQTNGQIDLANAPEGELVASHFSGIGIAGRSDKQGLSFTTFTPTGLLPLLAVGGVLTARQVAHVIAESRPPEPVVEHRQHATPAEKPSRKPASEAAPQGGRTRTLSDLFAAIEKATGATIDYPDQLGTKEVAYSPKSGDLGVIMKELSKLAGFDFELREVDGEKLVIVSEGGSPAAGNRR